MMCADSPFIGMGHMYFFLVPWLKNLGLSAIPRSLGRDKDSPNMQKKKNRQIQIKLQIKRFLLAMENTQI